MSPSSAGKRDRERQKVEKAQAKAERKAARQAAGAAPGEDGPARSEAEIIEDLSALHQAFEAGEISLEDFEARRDDLQAEFGQLS
jgi:hypothetical protein